MNYDICQHKSPLCIPEWKMTPIKTLITDMKKGKRVICPRNYTEAIMWFSHRDMLKIDNSIRIYPFESATIIHAYGRLYLEYDGKFIRLGKCKEIVIRKKAR
jgi:hypothetical protein